MGSTYWGQHTKDLSLRSAQGGREIGRGGGGDWGWAVGPVRTGLGGSNKIYKKILALAFIHKVQLHLL